MARTVLKLMAAASFVAVGACGFTGNLRLNPGYANLGSPGIWDTDREFGISLGPLPLRVARLFFADDPELSAIMKDVRAVRVYTYEVHGDAERVHERIEATHRRLVADDWLPVVAVREDGGLVTALVRLDEPDRLRGLVVMVQDDEDVVLVNVIGALKPETFAFAMDELGIDLPTTSVAMRGTCFPSNSQQALAARIADDGACQAPYASDVPGRSLNLR